MHSFIRAPLFWGALVVFLAGAILGGGQGVAHAQYSFTYTSDDTVEAGALWDTTEFHAVLTNTGSVDDSFLVTLTELPPTPQEWWVELCAAGGCQDTLVTQVNVFLPAGLWEDEWVNVMPRTSGHGKFQVTVQSYGNGATDGITFLLSAYQGPVTNRWGIIVLATLIISTGLYLLHRRYRLAKQRQS